jgi:TRAP-type C4-dicarboxylate transport system substrate-binding protein
MRCTRAGRRLALMTRAPLLVAATAAAALSIAGCLGGGSERVGGEQPADTRVVTMLDPFSNGQEVAAFGNEVARLSHGALRVRVINVNYKGPDYEAAAIRDMRDGRADLAFAASRAWDEFGAKRLRALHAPLLIDSYRLEERVLESDLLAPMLDELRPLGLVGIGILPGPIRRPFGISHPLAAPRDFRGLTIGTQQSSVADATVRALGASPQRLPADASGLSGVDGVERQVAAIESDRLDVKGSHLMTNVDLWPRPLVVFANERSYGELTSSQRSILRRAAANVVSKSTTTQQQFDAETSSNLCRKGHATFDSATSGELRALRSAVEPVYRQLRRDQSTADVIDSIERLKRRLGAPPTELPSCERGASEPSTPAATKIDGVWRMDTDESASRPEFFPENWGHWIFVLDRGRFAFTQENKPSCTWGYGKFAVHGNRMSWTFTDGGGIAPSGAMNRPGEFMVYDFSAYRDTLTLTPVKGEVSPLNFRDKPWRRLSETPTRHYFSRRCPPPAAALGG